MKFTYQGSEHDLLEIVGKDNLSRADSGDGMIISKAGMIILLQHFPDIDCTFGSLERFTLKGNDVLAVQACAFNKRDDTLPIGRSFGELSTRNADDFAMTYPVCTVENRGRNRAVIRHLGIEGVFSEEEIKSLPTGERPSSSTNGASSEEDKQRLLAKVKELTSELGWDDAKRVRLYCVALGIDKTTPKSEVSKQLTVEALKKAVEIAEEKKANA
jgi:hypothetical protein